MIRLSILVIKQVKITLSTLTFCLISACSFVELNPAARHIIFANNDSCELVELFEARVQTENAYINRTDKAISEELQILAQNAAFENNANAIWPDSKIENGSQTFKLLRCKQ